MRRFIPALVKLNYEPHLLSALPTIHHRCKKLGIRSTLCKSVSNDRAAPIENCLEYLIGDTDRKLTTSIYHAFFRAANDIIKAENVAACFLWSGTRTQSRATVAACRQNEIDTAIMELANISGRLFVDPLGTNAESWLYGNYQCLDNYPAPAQQFESWKQNQISARRASTVVKQAANSVRIKYEYGFDYMLWLFGAGQRLTHLAAPLVLFSNRKTRSHAVLGYDELLPDREFIFFPFQVSKDSQLRIHSEVDNIQALTTCIDIAEQNNMPLVTKVHPAENHLEFLDQVQVLKEQNNFIITKHNTFEILERAKRVVLINSSIAQEVALIDKPVECLGRSYFKFFNRERFASYVFNYLLEIDYFSGQDISTEAANQVLTRSHTHVTNTF